MPEPPDPIDFPLLVRQLREARGLTQEQLARELGVVFSSVNGWENGKHRPSPIMRERLLAAAAGAGVAPRMTDRGKILSVPPSTPKRARRR